MIDKIFLSIHRSLSLDLLANCTLWYIYSWVDHSFLFSYGQKFSRLCVRSNPRCPTTDLWNLSNTASSFKDLTSESWVLNLFYPSFVIFEVAVSSISKLDLRIVYTKFAELSLPWSNIGRMDLVSRNLRWRSSWVHWLLHSGLQGGVLRKQSRPYDQFGHSRIWKVHNVIVVRSDSKTFA